MRMVLGESLVIGLCASLGGAAGPACSRALGTWSYTRNFVQPTLSAEAVVLGIAVLTIFAGVAGSLYPAYRGATCVPLTALHFE